MVPNNRTETRRKAAIKLYLLLFLTLMSSWKEGEKKQFSGVQKREKLPYDVNKWTERWLNRRKNN